MRIIDELNRYGFVSPAVNGEQLAACLERYVGELELFNAAYDLVGAGTRDEIISRHILDSLAGIPVLAELFSRLGASEKGNGITAADVGSGAGLPGIPLAAAFPDVSFTLVERMSRRCAFLESCAAVLGLKNVQVMQKEAEKVTAASFDVIVFRAYRPLDGKILASLLRLLKPQGYLAAYKAKSEKIRAEMTEVAALAPLWEQKKLDAAYLGGESGLHERSIVLIPAAQ